MISPRVWKEARRANRDEGLGTSMPGRIFGVLGFLAVVWYMSTTGDADGNGLDLGDLIGAVVITIGGLAMLGFGLSEDYRDAQSRLNNTKEK